MDHREYIRRYGDDMPEIKNWTWGGGPRPRRARRRRRGITSEDAGAAFSRKWAKTLLHHRKKLTVSATLTSLGRGYARHLAAITEGDVRARLAVSELARKLPHRRDRHEAVFGVANSRN